MKMPIRLILMLALWLGMSGYGVADGALGMTAREKVTGTGQPSERPVAQSGKPTAAREESAEIRDLREQAEQGDNFAQYKLGMSYATGDGVTKDIVRTNMWASIAETNAKEEEKSSGDTGAEVSRMLFSAFRKAVVSEMSPEQLEQTRRLPGCASSKTTKTADY